MGDKPKTVTRLCEAILSGDIAILCGAGISRDSGLPIVAELVPYLLEKMNATESEVTTFTKAQLPFEAFIDTIASEASIDRLLKIYKGGIPNATHALLAELVKNHLVKTICTTNFDLLIESAFADAGLVENVDYVVLTQDSDFDEIQLKRNIPILIKLHGCISNAQELAISIKKVANKFSIDKRASVITHLFSDGQHSEVLVLGYSCSDAFDVFPAICSIKKKFKRVWFVSHVDEPINNLNLKVENIRCQKHANPFANFPNGERLFCKTPWLISQLRRSCVTNRFEPARLQPGGWKHHVDQWSQQNPRSKTQFIFRNIVGKLFSRISEYQITLVNHRVALTEARDSGELDEAAHTLNLLGAVFGRLSQLNNSEESFLGAKREAKRLKNVTVELSALANLAILCDQRGEHRKSIEYAKRGLELAQGLKDIEATFRIVGKLGVSHSLIGEYPEAIKYYTTALKYVTESGDKYHQQTLLGNLGVVYRRMGNSKDARQCFEQALEISRKLSDPINEINALQALGNVCSNAKQYEAAERYFLEAKEIAEHKNLDVQLAFAIDGLGLVLYNREEYREAIELFESALEINLRLGNVRSQEICLDHIGISFAKLGEFWSALKYHKDALRIAESIGNDETVAIVRANVAYALAGLGRTELAIQNYNSSLTMLRQRLGDQHPIVKEVEENLREVTTN